MNTDIHLIIEDFDLYNIIQRNTFQYIVFLNALQVNLDFSRLI